MLLGSPAWQASHGLRGTAAAATTAHMGEFRFAGMVDSGSVAPDYRAGPLAALMWIKTPALTERWAKALEAPVMPAAAGDIADH